jgi:quercetin dioxygenase-like cupin family protein
MSKAGDIFNNPVTGETGYVRIGTDQTDGKLLVSDLRVRAGGASIGPHFHPTIDERFTVLKGKIGYILDGKKGVLQAGDAMDLPKGIPHDWWNAGDEEARVIVEIRPGARFERMAITLFYLAAEGKTDKKGMANPLQMAVIAQEFSDAVVFMSPPQWVQRLLFGIMAPLGRLAGFKATYPHHLKMAIGTVEVEPLPEGVVIATA